MTYIVLIAGVTVLNWIIFLYFSVKKERELDKEDIQLLKRIDEILECSHLELKSSNRGYEILDLCKKSSRGEFRGIYHILSKLIWKFENKIKK